MASEHDSTGDGFVRLSLATTVATYVLIAVGALVRAAGAGLGCPDWPRCFGGWIPPLSADALPPGLDADKFNVFETWLEYVNRLTGVTIGLLIFATLIYAWRRHRRQPHIFWPVVAAFALVGFEGWLGGQVVAAELQPDVLTAHLIVALIIVGLLLYAHLCARLGRLVDADAVTASQRRLSYLGWLVGGLVLVQIGVGIRVRSALQGLETAGVPRADWLPMSWWPDIAHRQLAVVMVAACAGLAWAVRRWAPAHRAARRWADRTAIVGALQIAVGLGLAYAQVPPSLQVLHLAVASLLVGALSVFLFYATRVPARADE